MRAASSCTWSTRRIYRDAEDNVVVMRTRRRAKGQSETGTDPGRRKREEPTALSLRATRPLIRFFRDVRTTFNPFESLEFDSRGHRWNLNRHSRRITLSPVIFHPFSEYLERNGYGSWIPETRYFRRERKLAFRDRFDRSRRKCKICPFSNRDDTSGTRHQGDTDP